MPEEASLVCACKRTRKGCKRIVSNEAAPKCITHGHGQVLVARQGIKVVHWGSSVGEGIALEKDACALANPCARTHTHAHTHIHTHTHKNMQKPLDMHTRAHSALPPGGAAAQACKALHMQPIHSS
eukprot:1161979-Pelagomonas_calceolata.AAC.12